MAKVKNVSSVGDMDVPSLGIQVKAGATVDISDEAAALLLDQPDNWAAADQAALKATPTQATPDTPASAE